MIRFSTSKLRALVAPEDLADAMDALKAAGKVKRYKIYERWTFIEISKLAEINLVFDLSKSVPVDGRPHIKNKKP